ncbi:LamG domain-containing protein [Halovenus marina]|uniref:LamG domain-containing protein n=1 Tax=Halovenus marina TaxID=3396621 RepID=UPI003F557D11
MNDETNEDANDSSLLEPSKMTRRSVLAGTVGLAFLPKYTGASDQGPGIAQTTDSGPSQANGNAPIEIGQRLELFVDDYLIEEVDGVRSNYHHPTPEEVVVVHDEPWEGGSSIYHSLFEDPAHPYDYRMYYRGSGFEDSPGQVAYIESDDGLDWEKPNLTDDDRNLVPDLNSIAGTPAVFKDGNPDAPEEERYKAVGATGGGLSGFVSPDGFNWTPLDENPIITDGAFDSQNTAIWDPVQEEYRAFWRFFDDTGRSIRTARSDDFRQWTDQKDLSYPEAPPEQLYTNNIKPYYRAPHIWLGFPARYVERDPDSQSLRELPGWDLREGLLPSRSGYAVTDTLFMSSRDGETFSRAPEAFIRPGLWEDDAENNWFYGDNYPAWQVVEIESPDPARPEELSLYATEKYRTGQNEPGNGASQLRRFSLRVDGFVSMHAPLIGGEFVTKPIIFDGDQLVLNFATSAAGSIRIELQNPGGQPYQGFSLSESPEIFGDDIERVVEWPNANLGTLAGRPVRIRFVMSDADLYSFRFQGEGGGPTIEEPENPVSHYPFDRVLGGEVFADASGNGNDATNNGGTVDSGTINNAVRLDQNDTWADTPTLSIEDEISVAGWVNTEAVDDSHFILTGADDEGKFILYLFNDQPTWWLGTDDSQGYRLARNPSISTGQWVHLAGTYDGSDLRLYVDGSLAATQAVDVPDLLEPVPCRIGADTRPGQDGNFEFLGRIDDMWVFDRTLSESEVQDLYNNAAQPSNPVAHYPFDQLQQTDEFFEDASSNGNDATNSGAVIDGGVIDNAIRLDRNDTWADTPTLPFQNGVSVAGWVNTEDTSTSHFITTGADDEGKFILYLNGNQPTWWLNTEGGPVLARNPSIATNEWVHVAGTYDGNDLRLYVDGQEVATQAVNDADLLEPVPCRVGADSRPGSEGDFEVEGRIDDMWIFDRALEPGEIAYLYNEGSS